VSLLKRTSCNALSLRPVAVTALGLYLLVHLFLILCLTHPHNTHLQGQADSHPVSVCAWVHKTVASHVPSLGIVLSLIAAAPLAFLPVPRRAFKIRSVTLTGRSPPLLIPA